MKKVKTKITVINKATGKKAKTKVVYDGEGCYTVFLPKDENGLPFNEGTIIISHK